MPTTPATTPTSTSTSTTRALHSLEPYKPPPFAARLPHPPTRRFALGILPTPIHRWKGALEEEKVSSKSVDLFIKRDDLSGLELSGNKVRKLEFLVADALNKGADALLSIGGIQSNHARAVAAAARAAGLECHLILRTRKSETEKDPGFAGNLLIERLLGAHIHLVSKEDYAAAGDGGWPLLLELAERLKSKSPYLIPLGGSNALGAWGYLEASREIMDQAPAAIRRESGSETQEQFDAVALATGSAGTAAGLALGLHLAGSRTRVIAFSVCDDPGYFYSEVQKHVDELWGGGGIEENGPPPRARDIITVVQAKGSGYAISRPEELKFLRDVASSSGILLDPVYTGKAVRALFEEIAAASSNSSSDEKPDDESNSNFDWRGKKVLFLHTGGLFGLYGAAEEVVAASGMVGEGVEAFRKVE